jgi:hypothetical protein
MTAIRRRGHLSLIVSAPGGLDAATEPALAGTGPVPAGPPAAAAVAAPPRPPARTPETCPPMSLRWSGWSWRRVRCCFLIVVGCTHAAMVVARQRDVMRVPWSGRGSLLGNRISGRCRRGDLGTLTWAIAHRAA